MSTATWLVCATRTATGFLVCPLKHYWCVAPDLVLRFEHVHCITNGCTICLLLDLCPAGHDWCALPDLHLNWCVLPDLHLNWCVLRDIHLNWCVLPDLPLDLWPPENDWCVLPDLPLDLRPPEHDWCVLPDLIAPCPCTSLLATWWNLFPSSNSKTTGQIPAIDLRQSVTNRNDAF